MYPIVVRVDAQEDELIRFRVTASAPPLLTSPGSTYGETGQQTPNYGGQYKGPARWFFLRTGSTVELEAIDDIDSGCVPTVANGCSLFLNWTGDCSGGDVCTLTPRPRAQEATAISAKIFG